MKPIERYARRFDSFQQRTPPLAFVFGVIKKFGDDNAGNLVSDLAYSGFLAVFPLLLVLVTVLGVVLSGDPSARNSVLHSTFSDFPLVGQQLSHNIHPLHRSSLLSLVVGLVGLTWGSLGVAQAGLFSMEQVWTIPGPGRPNFIKRLGRSVAFLGVLGGGLIISTFLAGFGTFGRHNIWLGAGGEVLALVVNVGQYMLAFRVLTPKSVATKDLFPGAIVGGVAWTILLAVGGYLIGHDLRNASNTYGTFATVLGLLAWVYLGAEISIYAAEINAVIKRRLWPRALVQPPLTSADQCSLSLQVTQNQRRPEQQVTVSFSEAPMTEEEFKAVTSSGAGASKES